MAPNSRLKRKVVEAAASVVSAMTPAGLLAKVVTLPSVGTLITSAYLGNIGLNFRSIANEALHLIYPRPSLGGLAEQFASRHIPSYAPLVAAFAALSLAEFAAMLKILKSIASMLRSDPSVITAPTPFEKTSLYQVICKMPVRQVLFALNICNCCLGRRLPAAESARLSTMVDAIHKVRKLSACHVVLTAVHFLAEMYWNSVKSPIGAALTSRIVKSTLAEPALSSSFQRQNFLETPLVKAGPTKNHTHGKSASERNAGSATAALAATQIGKTPYYFQMSLSDIRNGRVGDRSIHWAKDLGVPPTEFWFDPATHAGVLIDVDHYLDMPNLLARFPATYFISTFQPSAAACSEGEFSFRFLPTNEVEYRVSGGAKYVHQVWDYSGDTILTSVATGLCKTVVAYHIDRKRINDHHCLIMLSVLGTFELPSFVPTSWVIEGACLKRLAPVNGNHVVLDVVTKDGLNRSVSLLDTHLAATLPKGQLDAVTATASVAKVPITPAMVASNIAPTDGKGLPMEKLPPGFAATIASYVRAGIPRTPPVVYPPSESMIYIGFSKYDDCSPVPLKSFGSPLIGPCYGFYESIYNADQCIKGRVEAFTGRHCHNTVPPTLAKYMSEFIERLIPESEVHTGEPVSHDEVHERQDRPSQRNILEEANYSGKNFRAMVRSFIKKETAVKPTDPRNISTLSAQIKLSYSTFLYAFTDQVMKKQKWYAFGYTPQECADIVCEILKEERHSVCADANRFDGHVERWQRVLERAIMLRYFKQQYHAEINENLDKQVGLKGVTTEGRQYFTEFSRLSGSPETSTFNSVESAFIGYVGWRTTVNPKTGKVYSPDEAWAKLGMYGGDDSIEGAIDPAALKNASDLIGHSYKIKVIPRGEIGVEFLNRQFGPDVWTGDNNSLANPSRLLAKLWVGPSVLPSPIDRFAERASGYYRTDRNSPVIGDIVKVAQELLGDRPEGILTSWAGKHPVETNWPNEDSGWMIDVFNASIPDFDFERFHEWLRQCLFWRRPALLLQAPLCTAAPTNTPAPTVSSIIGDDLVIIDEELPASAPKTTKEVSPSGVKEIDAANALVPVLKLNGARDHEVEAKLKKFAPMTAEERTKAFYANGLRHADIEAIIEDWELNSGKTATQTEVESICSLHSEERKSQLCPHSPTDHCCDECIDYYGDPEGFTQKPHFTEDLVWNLIPHAKKMPKPQTVEALVLDLTKRPPKTPSPQPEPAPAPAAPKKNRGAEIDPKLWIPSKAAASNPKKLADWEKMRSRAQKKWNAARSPPIDSSKSEAPSKTKGGNKATGPVTKP